MRRRETITILLMGLGVLVWGGVALGGALISSPGALVVTASSSGFDGNVTLDPPPLNMQPGISSDAAIDVLEEEFPSVDITSVTAQFALFSWVAQPVDENDRPTGPPYYSGAPAWVLSVKGLCLSLDPESGVCANDLTNIVIDATSGEFVLAYPANDAIQAEPMGQS